MAAVLSLPLARSLLCADPEILLRSSRLQKRLSQPRGTQSAIAGIAAAGLTSVALEPSSVEMAGISSSSSASPLVSSGSLSIAQISESIQMVRVTRGHAAVLCQLKEPTSMETPYTRQIPLCLGGLLGTRTA